MDERQKQALLRLNSGEAPEDIYADLSVTVDQLAEWDRTTESSELRPAGLSYISSTLSPPQQGTPRTNLGM